MVIKQQQKKIVKNTNKSDKPLIELIGLTKEYNGNIVLKGINLTINENEFVTLLGPSGCGKTTTLRIIGGFEKPTSGQVLFDGKDIDELESYQRPSNTVFQKYALFPHYNVEENVAFGLTIRNINNTKLTTRIRRKLGSKHVSETEKVYSKEMIAKKVTKMLKLVGLEGFEKRQISSLSGGQQQRVAIARALINEPKVLLLDEPLGALDLKLRQEMQYELKEIQRNTGITFIFVTHDQEEALTMSDKIVVMRDGIIQQVGTPEDIYNEPLNEFVANFVGESNIIDGNMKKDYLVNFDGKDIECVDRGFSSNEQVNVVIRPEDIDIVPEGEGVFDGIVDYVIFKGVHFEIDVKTSNRIYTIHTTDYQEEGKKVAIKFGPEDIHIMEKLENVSR
ncbi:MAG: ABC transporter ATP-binding protein [Bacilli bacterium]|nr:ABC transporter ATP-binding protein [Bacilli bacterium]